MAFESITIETTVAQSIEKVWAFWNQPEHVMMWNNASPDWYTPEAANDLRPGGSFSYIMAARDGSYSFDFSGVYDEVRPMEALAYTLGDERKVSIRFYDSGGVVRIVETFEAETENSLEMQRMGWQAILDNFKLYAETH